MNKSPDIFSVQAFLASNDTQISYAERQMAKYFADNSNVVYMGLKMRPLRVSPAEHGELRNGKKIFRGRQAIVCTEKISCKFSNGWQFFILLCSNEGDK